MRQLTDGVHWHGIGGSDDLTNIERSSFANKMRYAVETTTDMAFERLKGATANQRGAGASGWHLYNCALPALIGRPPQHVDTKINMPDVTDVTDATDVADDTKTVFRDVVGPLLTSCANDRYVRAEMLQLAILARPVDATLLRISKAGGYTNLKFFMDRIYKAKFVSTARLHGHANPVASCFTNPLFVAT